MPDTNFNELKDAWNQLSEKLDRQNAIAFSQLKENKLSRFRSGMQPLALGQTLQLIIGVVVTAFSVRFWATHTSSPALLVSGVLMQLYGIMFSAFAIRDLILIREIDYSAPILVIQKQLANLRAWHIRTAFWSAITGSVIWLPVMLIMLSLLGVDVAYSARKMCWLIATVLVCVAFNYLLFWLARSGGQCGVALQRSWIGRAINRAQQTLDEIAQFEREAI